MLPNTALLTGLGLRAGVAFLLDPQGGARRRALLRDKAFRSTRMSTRAIDATTRDVVNRTRGIAAATRELGRVCSHPRAIDVEASDARVTLRGPILAEEMDDVVAMAGSVRGVTSVLNALEPHESADGIPSLQGEGRVAGPMLDLCQSNWAPATRALVGLGALAAAAALAAYARR